MYMGVFCLQTFQTLNGNGNETKEKNTDFVFYFNNLEDYDNMQ